MSQVQTVNITAHVNGGEVTLDSDHPRLTRHEGQWHFKLDRTAPSQVVFHLHVSDQGEGEWSVSSALAKISRDPHAGDGYLEPQRWSGTNPFVSAAFGHNDSFKLEIESSSAAPQPPPSGGGFFVVEDEGGGL